MAKGKNTVAIVTDLATPVAKECGVNVWDVRFEKEGSIWYLRIIIDKDGGVDINDCENVSRKLDKILDEVDPIDQSYCLEVSSPGIERELVKKEHFDAFMGEEVLVRFIRPVENGERDFEGWGWGSRRPSIHLGMVRGITPILPRYPDNSPQ